MKLIIDISDELFKDIQDNILFGDEYHDAVWELNGAIINGIPLEDIRKEIEQTVKEECNNDLVWSSGLKYALKIIDKHIGERSE